MGASAIYVVLKHEDEVDDVVDDVFDDVVDDVDNNMSCDDVVVASRTVLGPSKDEIC
jgi:hypothetical protein